MMLTAYCLGFGSWTVNFEGWRTAVSKLRDQGFEALGLSFSEGEMFLHRRIFDRQIEIAHQCGLKVFVAPSRLGGRFAGSPQMISLWLTMHPECQVPGHPDLACIEAEPFVQWIQDFLSTLIRDHAVDGVIWDESKRSGLISTHPATVKKFGGVPTTEQAQDSFVEFLDELSSCCIAIRPNLVITMFNTAGAPEYFTSRAARIPHIQYCGYDGNFCQWSFFREPPRQDKYLLGDVWERTVRECADGGKKTFALVENFCIPKSEHDTYYKNLDDYLGRIRPDHLAVYCGASNNECPEEVERMTMNLLRKHRFAR